MVSHTDLTMTLLLSVGMQCYLFAVCIAPVIAFPIIIAVLLTNVSRFDHAETISFQVGEIYMTASFPYLSDLYRLAP